MNKQTGKSENSVLIDNLVDLLNKGDAHVSLDEALKDIPFEILGKKAGNLPYSLWQITEHIRIAQFDILEFSRDPDYQSPKWPEGYWPTANELGNAALWQESVKNFREDLKQVEELISDSSIDLLAKIPHGSGQTILREALLVADHNAYHLGVLLAISRLLANK